MKTPQLFTTLLRAQIFLSDAGWREENGAWVNSRVPNTFRGIRPEENRFVIVEWKASDYAMRIMKFVS